MRPGDETSGHRQPATGDLHERHSGEPPERDDLDPGPSVRFRLKVVVIPVADYDRSKSFYVGLGWRVDVDLDLDNGYRMMHLTPPGSHVSYRPRYAGHRSPAQAAAGDHRAPAGPSLTKVPDREGERLRWTWRPWRPCCTKPPKHHDTFAKEAPPHEWWDWYAAYIQARQQGVTPEQASAAADCDMAEVKHVVTPVDRT